MSAEPSSKTSTIFSWRKVPFNLLNNFGNLVFQNNVENNRTFPCSVAWISPDLPSSSDSSTWIENALILSFSAASSSCFQQSKSQYHPPAPQLVLVSFSTSLFSTTVMSLPLCVLLLLTLLLGCAPLIINIGNPSADINEEIQICARMLDQFNKVLLSAWIWREKKNDPIQPTCTRLKLVLQKKMANISRLSFF